MPLDPRDLAAIGTDLSRLAGLLREARLQLPGRQSDEFKAERDEILLAFDGYLEPRIGAPDAPIVAAIVGPGGVGKSTLVNSLAQEMISATGAVRPTTRFPMVWGDSSHDDEYWSDFSARIARHLGEHVNSVLTESPMTTHLTLIDTPPLYEGDDTTATQAVAVSDLCVFVTSPTRYADGRSWEFLRQTRRRGIPILFVVNRLPGDVDEQGVILGDFAARLHARALLAAPDPSLLFGITEGPVDLRAAALHPDHVGAIRKELAEVADPIYRHGLIDETVYATARMVAERARALTRPMAAEQPLVEDLLDVVAGAYEMEANVLEIQLRAGDVLSADELRDWGVASSCLAGIITRRAGAAAHLTASEWVRLSEAAGLSDLVSPALWRHSHDTSNAAALALDSWKSGLEPLVKTHARLGRLRWRSGPRAVAALWRTALSGGHELPRKVRRKFAEEGRELITTARVELSEALRRALAHDAERFTRLLGSEIVDDLYSSIVGHADGVDARLDGLATQIPSAWSEPVEDVEVVAPSAEQDVTVHIGEGSTTIELGGDQLYRRIEPMARPEPDTPEALGPERSN